MIVFRIIIYASLAIFESSFLSNFNSCHIPLQFILFLNISVHINHWWSLFCFTNRALSIRCITYSLTFVLVVTYRIIIKSTVYVEAVAFVKLFNAIFEHNIYVKYLFISLYKRIYHKQYFIYYTKLRVNRMLRYIYLY